MVTLLPPVSVAKSQVSVPTDRVQLPALGFTDTNVTSLGSVSVTVTPVASSALLFTTVMT